MERKGREQEPDTPLTKYLSVSPFFKGVDVVELELKKVFSQNFWFSQKIWTFTEDQHYLLLHFCKREKKKYYRKLIF